ncbi:hypothetical protein HaLaN_11114 [Haematococcus lacustris]|uniref:Uncharacterized protein n=1 Tax=Haematococcus lacustris TaxID=44745 RepID=A0A699YZI4_HAELA|nr:hypothetical protein HaLaN_11114 [Haematococcus lacustris]
MQPITLSDVSDVLDQHLLPKLERVLHAAQFKAQRAVKELAVSEDETAVVASREDTLADLASAYAEMEAMQSTLADSAIYVRAPGGTGWI